MRPVDDDVIIITGLLVVIGLAMQVALCCLLR